MRDDRDAFGDDGADAARVIEVMVRQHAVANRLVRNHALRLGDDRLRARLVLAGRLEDQDVIVELDGERDVAARDAVDAVREPFRCGRRRSRRCAARGGGAGRRRPAEAAESSAPCRFAGFACAPKICASNVGQPPRRLHDLRTDTSGPCCRDSRSTRSRRACRRTPGSRATCRRARRGCRGSM